MKAEKRDPIDFLMDILESIENIDIENFIEGFDFEKFSKDKKQYMQWYELLRSLGKRQKICQIL